MNGFIPVENNDPLSAVRGLLRQLLESGLVDALFIPLEMDSGVTVPALVTDIDQLEHANPFVPAMSINSARLVSALTDNQTPAALGVVLHPCELRALIELVKLQQASLEDVILISMDCPGTYEWTDFTAMQRAGEFNLAEYLSAATRAQVYNDHGLRQACQMCTQPIPEGVNIHLQLFGADLASGIPVTLDDKLAEVLEINAVQEHPVENRQAVLEPLLEQRQQVRQKELAAMRARIEANGGLFDVFATCIRCYNCSTACPLCYCKTCLFCTAAFDHPPEHYLNAARRKGAMRLPADTMLFHLTRMNHMGLSCVSCGMCTSACPSDIPVGVVFSLIGGQVQHSFGYTPGANLEEPLPLITFQMEEWVEIGEKR
jgi:formate dehydrogenase subunit beta